MSPLYGTLPKIVLAVVVVVLYTAPLANVQPATAAAGGIANRAPGRANVWHVTSTGDSGPGTLRQTLMEARAGDTILFDPSVFPPASPATVFLASQLLSITQHNLTIDASDAGVILDGSSIKGEVFWGLGIEANGVTVRGLQIINFASNGIELRGQNNTIGGDRNLGAGPLGQGNLLSRNAHAGIGLHDSGTFSNTIQGNLIGVDPTGTFDWGNGGDGIHLNAANRNVIRDNVIGWNAMGIQGCCTTDTSHNLIRDNWIGINSDGSTPIPNDINGVWFHDGAGFNTIGPGNVIAYNGSSAIVMHTAASRGNTITQNSVFENGGGIELNDGSNGGLAAPQITSFELASGMLMGYACMRCTVEVFSDAGNQGGMYEGSTQADEAGQFTFYTGTPLAGPHLTVTATDADGNTSPFSLPTSGSGAEWVIQTGNEHFITRLEPQRSQDLADNRMGSGAGALWTLGDLYAWFDGEIASSGVKHFKVSIQEGEEPIDWRQPELSINPYYDDWITYVADQGMTITYMLSFWDKANHPNGWTGIQSRFKTAEEVQRFQEFVQFIVPHFCDRVSYFEIWSEPDNAASPVQYIEPEDYIAVTHAVIPLIRDACPHAKIVVGSTAYLRNSESYLMTIVQSDLMPLVDVVAWHSMFGSSPAHPEHSDFYYSYPAIVQRIKDEAIAHGFSGEFRGDEIVWRSPDCPWCAAEDPLYTDITAAKYFARGITINLGLDLNVSPTGISTLRKETFAVVQNLATVFAGATTVHFPVEIQSPIARLASYTFALPNDGHLVALWNDGAAVDEDPGVESTLILPGFAGQIAVGIDPLHGLVQPLVTSNDGQNLVIRGLRVKDYPLLVRLSPMG